MGESDRYHEHKLTKKRKFSLGQPGNALFALFAANILFFFLILLAKVFYLFTHQGLGTAPAASDGLEWFAVPANLNTLAQKPWTVFTFMFSMGGMEAVPLFITMLANMLWLWSFGYILQDISGNRYIFPVYIYGSLAGMLFFLTATNILPPFKQNANTLFLFGSQTGSAALALAVTTFAPNYRIFRNLGTGIPVWVLTGLFLLINLVNAFSYANANSFALLGGALTGFLFVYLLRKGKDTSSWMHNFYNWISTVFTPGKPNKQQRIKEKVFYNTGDKKPFSKTSNVTQQRVDEILDKISQKGYNYLTEDEKNILRRASEEEL